MPASRSRSRKSLVTSCMARTSTPWSRTVATICPASAAPWLVLRVMTRADVSDADGAAAPALRCPDALKKPRCQ